MTTRNSAALVIAWVAIHFCLHHYFRLLGVIAELLEETERLQVRIAEIEIQRGES